MPHVTFLPYEIHLEVPRGTSLLAAADEAAEMTSDDFFTGELCEGRHECGNCCVEVVDGADHLSPMTESERSLMVTLKQPADVRSSCTARVLGDVTVRLLGPISHSGERGQAQMQAHP
jgi:uncharacterized 2Fe-2S/4Fe-4S cluster protein (DUF4445 family)